MQGALVLASSFFVAACAHPSVSASMPPSLAFVVLDGQGRNLLTSVNTPLRVSWIASNGERAYLGSECAEGECTMVREGHSATGAPPYHFYYLSVGASQVSASGHKTFYLELAGQVDTLYYDVQKTRLHGHQDTYRIKLLLFNGLPAYMNPAQLPVYVFRRQR